MALCARQVETLQNDLESRLLNLKEAVQTRTAVSTAGVVVRISPPPSYSHCYRDYKPEIFPPVWSLVQISFLGARHKHKCMLLYSHTRTDTHNHSRQFQKQTNFSPKWYKLTSTTHVITNSLDE